MILERIRRKVVGFVSEIDRFLVKFDHTHQKTPAQLAEIQKYNKIKALRDTSQQGSK